MPDYIDFSEVKISVNSQLPRFDITAIDATGVEYKGVGTRGNNGDLLNEVCDKAKAAYPTAAPIRLCVNKTTKRILQDPNHP